MSSTTPADSPPGETTVLPGQVNSETKGPAILAAMWTLAVVGLLAIIFRIFSKRRQQCRYWGEDWLLSLSWIFVLVQAICVTFAVRFSFGKHTSNIPPADLVKMYAWTYTPPSFAYLGATVSKTAFGVLLLRLAGHRRCVRALLWFGLISMNLILTAGALTFWVQCRPLQKAWRPEDAGSCWPEAILVYSGIVASAYSGLMDLVFAFIPWILAKDLYLSSRGQQVQLAGIMCLGAVAAGASFVKIAYIPFVAEGDFSWEAMPLMIWAEAETVITIVAASAPVFGVLVRDAGEKSSIQSEPDTRNMVRRWTISDHAPTTATLTGGTLERRQSIKDRNWYTSGKKGSADTLVDKQVPGVIRIREVPTDV